MGAIARRGLALVLLLTACEEGEFVALRDEIVPEPRLLTASQVSAGIYHTLVVRDGVIYGSGRNDAGQLGAGGDTVTFNPIDDSRTWVSAGAGDSHSCALDDAGRVYCWGANNVGQLGVNDLAPRSTPTEVPLPGPARTLAVRHETACVILTDDELYCWGYNEENGLAQPVLFANQKHPERIAPVAGGGWREVGVGQGHVCAIAASGGLYCSGRNTERQASSDATPQLGVFTQVGTATDWWWVDASILTTCGLRGGIASTAGELWCWGDNGSGQLGQGDTAQRVAPVRVGGTRRWSKVIVAVLHTCAIDEAGVLACWGRNFEGQLGAGAAPVDIPVVTDVPGSPFRDLALGRLNTLAIADDDRVSGAGANDDGQLGLGDADNRNVMTSPSLP